MSDGWKESPGPFQPSIHAMALSDQTSTSLETKSVISINSIRISNDICSSQTSQCGEFENPHEMFLDWREEAIRVGLVMPDSAVLTTSTKIGKTSSRTVCFRRLERGQFVFLTDSRSKKCKEIYENPQGAVTFMWAFVKSNGLKVVRQVRLEGKVRALQREYFEDLYWEMRPNRRIRAYICEQGRRVNWDDLQLRHDQLQDEVYAGKELPMPKHFVAYEMQPFSMEFYETLGNQEACRLLFLIPVRDRYAEGVQSVEQDSNIELGV